MPKEGRWIYIETEEGPSTTNEDVLEVDAANDWRAPLKEYIEQGALSKNELKAKKLRQRATWFTIVNGNLYKQMETCTNKWKMGQHYADA